MSNSTDQASRPNIDFSHRLNFSRVSENTLDSHLTDLSETIESMSGRAAAIIRIASEHFCNGSNPRTNFDDAMFFTLQSAIKELNDISATVWAYNDLIKDFHNKEIAQCLDKAGIDGGVK